MVERFHNGAHPYLRLRFRSDHPHEVRIAAFMHDDSARIRHCVLTATMGNYARLRRLHLADRTVTSHELWPGFHGHGFAPHKRFPLDRLMRSEEGHATIETTTDETNPQAANYAPGTFIGWKYQGLKAAQYWRCESPPDTLEVWVNARDEYWATRSPIPGGVSFENFELMAPFENGREIIFGVRPLQPGR